MLLPSLATTFTLAAIVSSSPHQYKRQSTDLSAAASAALVLNSAVAKQVCVIAQSAFAAAQALGSTAQLSGCDALLGIKTSANVATILQTSGCYYADSNAPGGPQCPNATVASNGGIALASPGSTATTFLIASSNGKCSGISDGFMLSVQSSTYFTVTSFLSIKWKIDCSTGIITLSDSSLHLCLSGGALYATTSTNTCSEFYNITAIGAI